jgi:hypothetical protein
MSAGRHLCWSESVQVSYNLKFILVMSMEIKDPADNRLLSLYLPHKRLCKVDKWYQCDTAVRKQYVLSVTSPVSHLTQTSFTIHSVQ